MKQVFTRVTVLLWLLVTVQAASAQLLAFTKDQQVRSTIEKVLMALPGQLQPITGQLISIDVQSKEFESKVLLPGSLANSIVHYASVDNKKTIAAWHSTVLETDEFTKASKKFKWLYSQLKGSYSCGGRKLSLSAAYEAPKEEMPFTNIIFEQKEGQSNERIQLSMQFEVTTWVIRLAIYNEDKETERLIKQGPATAAANDY